MNCFRAWEIPGTAHADNYTIRVGFIDNGSAPLDDIVAAYAPTDELMGHAVVVLHQLRPAAPLRAAGSHRGAEHLGSNRRTRTDRRNPSP